MFRAGILLFLCATSFGAAGTQSTSVYPRALSAALMSPLSKPRYIVVDNSNGNISVVGVDGSNLYVTAADLEFSPDGLPATLELTDTQNGPIKIQIKYQRKEASADGTEEELRARHDPANGIIVTEKGLAVCGVMGIQRGMNYFCAPGLSKIKGPVGIANLTVGVPRDLLAGLRAVTMTGDIRVKGFPTDSQNRVLVLDSGYGNVSVEGTVANGGIHDCRQKIRALTTELDLFR